MVTLRNVLWLVLFIILISPHPSLAGHYANQLLSLNRLAQESSRVYSFQIGAAAEGRSGYRGGFGIPISGARVEITISSSYANSDSQRSYWIGVDLSDQMVIRVGYLVDLNANGGQPSWFWAYSKPGSRATENIQVGSIVGKDGDWVQFSLTRSDRTWTAYVGNFEVGSVDVGVVDSGGPYAVAEVSHTSSVNIDLRPVDFRNLTYRDTNSNWQPASAAVAICCYSIGSPRAQGDLPFGVAEIPGKNNYWTVGSHMPFVREGQRLWPWYYVKVESDYGSTSGSGWYVKGNFVSPQARTRVYQDGDTRKILVAWLQNERLIGGSDFIVDNNFTLRAYYKTQFFLSVRAQFVGTGSGWYDKGSPAQFSTIISPQPTLFSPCQWIFDGWNENGKQLSQSISGEIVMDAPHAVRGTWRISCHNCFFFDLCVVLVNFWYSLIGILAIILFAIAVVLALLFSDKSTRSSGGGHHIF